jgi:DNA polymerase III alpha subunit
MTVLGTIKDIREVKTKGGDLMAFVRIEHAGQAIDLVCFKDIWAKIKYGLEKDDLCLCYGQFCESYNQAHDKYSIKLFNLNRLTFLNLKDSFYIINIDNKNNNQIQDIKNILRNINKNDILNSRDIKTIIVFEKDGKKFMTKANLWVNNKIDLINLLFEKGLI